MNRAEAHAKLDEQLDRALSAAERRAFDALSRALSAGKFEALCDSLSAIADCREFSRDDKWEAQNTAHRLYGAIDEATAICQRLKSRCEIAQFE